MKRGRGEVGETIGAEGGRGGGGDNSIVRSHDFWQITLPMVLTLRTTMIQDTNYHSRYHEISYTHTEPTSPFPHRILYPSRTHLHDKLVALGEAKLIGRRLLEVSDRHRTRERLRGEVIKVGVHRITAIGPHRSDALNGGTPPSAGGAPSGGSGAVGRIPPCFTRLVIHEIGSTVVIDIHLIHPGLLQGDVEGRQSIRREDREDRYRKCRKCTGVQRWFAEAIITTEAAPSLPTMP